MQIFLYQRVWSIHFPVQLTCTVWVKWMNNWTTTKKQHQQQQYHWCRPECINFYLHVSIWTWCAFIIQYGICLKIENLIWNCTFCFGATFVFFISRVFSFYSLSLIRNIHSWAAVAVAAAAIVVFFVDVRLCFYSDKHKWIAIDIFEYFKIDFFLHTQTHAHAAMI